MTEEEMEGPISFWGYKEQESNLILPEHDDDDDKTIGLSGHHWVNTCNIRYKMDVQKCIAIWKLRSQVLWTAIHVYLLSKIKNISKECFYFSFMS